MRGAVDGVVLAREDETGETVKIMTTIDLPQNQQQFWRNDHVNHRMGIKSRSDMADMDGLTP